MAMLSYEGLVEGKVDYARMRSPGPANTLTQAGIESCAERILETVLHADPGDHSVQSAWTVVKRSPHAVQDILDNGWLNGGRSSAEALDAMNHHGQEIMQRALDVWRREFRYWPD